MTVTLRQLTAFALWQAAGYPADSAAAWVGNDCVEAGPNLPTAFRSGRLDHGSQGLLQWRDSATDKRLSKYQAWVAAQFPGASKDELWAHYGAMKLQVQYGALECRESFPALHAILLKGGDIAALTTAIMEQNERPSHDLKVNRLDLRIKYAEAVFAEGVHVGASTASTRANQAQLASKEAVKAHNSNAGVAVVLGAAVAGLHKFAALPGDMTFWAGLLALGAVVYSLIRAQRAALAVMPRHSVTVPPVMPKAAPLVVAAAPVAPPPTLNAADLAAIAKLLSACMANLEIEHQPLEKQL